MKIKKNRILLNIYWASIYKDVADKAFRSARLAKLGVQEEIAGEKLESEISLTSEDESMLRRAMTTALAEIQTLIIREHFVWEQSHIGNNRNLADDNIKITMMVPLNFDLAAVQPMAELMHSYIVQKAMYTWFSFTVPARAQEQLQLSQLTAENIKQLLRARVRMLTHGTEVDVNVGDTVTEVSEIKLSQTGVNLPEKDDTATVTAALLPEGAAGKLVWTISPLTTALTMVVSEDTKTCTVTLAVVEKIKRTCKLVATAANGVNASCTITYGKRLVMVTPDNPGTEAGGTGDDTDMGGSGTGTGGGTGEAAPLG